MSPEKTREDEEAGSIPPKVSGAARVPRKLAIVLGLTATFTVVELVGGALAHSLTLLAEAGHMGTDVAALGLALFGARIAMRRDGSVKRFGNLRWEVLAAMVNGIALFVIGLWISVEAVGRFAHPREIHAALFGAVAVVGLLVNLISLRVLHGDHTTSLNARGAYLHILGDVLGSVGAIVGAAVVYYTGWMQIDPIISVFVSLIILRSAWRLVRESALILLDRAPDHIDPAEVEKHLLAVEGVTRLHDVHLWTVAGGLMAMSAHVLVPDLEQHPVVLRRLEHEMNHLGIQHITIQLETREDCLAERCGEEATVVSGHHGHDHSHTHSH